MSKQLKEPIKKRFPEFKKLLNNDYFALIDDVAAGDDFFIRKKGGKAHKHNCQEIKPAAKDIAIMLEYNASHKSRTSLRRAGYIHCTKSYPQRIYGQK